MPAERTEIQAQAPASEPAFVLPEEIDEQTFQELLVPGSRASEPEPPEAASEDPPSAQEPTEAPPTAQPDMGQVLQALPAAIAQGVAAAMKSGQTAAPDITTAVVEKLKAENPGLDEAQAKWLTQTIGAVLTEHRKADQERIARLEQALVSTVQNQTGQQFMAFLDQQMDRLGIPRTDTAGEEAWERTVIRDHTVQACLKLGPQVTPEHAVRILKTINDRRIRTAIPTDPKYQQEKQQQQENAPPVRHARSGASASEGIRKALVDPKNRRMSFRGEDFQRLAAESINAANRATGRLLGGRQPKP